MAQIDEFFASRLGAAVWVTALLVCAVIAFFQLYTS